MRFLLRNLYEILKSKLRYIGKELALTTLNFFLQQLKKWKKK